METHIYKNRAKRWTTYLGIALFCMVPALYNSCQSAHQGDAQLQSTSGGGPDDPCSLDEFFERTYHPFLKSNCIACHTQGGIGKGAFADNNPVAAWTSFQLAGLSKVSANAVDPAHKPPYTGVHLKPAVDALNASWNIALAEAKVCEEGGGLPVDDGQTFDESEWYQLRSKAIGLAKVGDTGTVTWNLTSDIVDTGLPIPALSGAKFSLKVKVSEVTGKPYYMVMEPVLDLTGSNKDVTIDGLRVKLNGNYIYNETTFKNLHAAWRKGEGKDVILSYGAISAVGTLKATDVLSISFNKISIADLPPPPAPVMAKFRSKTFRPSVESGDYEVWVDLNAAVPDRAVTVGLEIDGATTATPIKSGRTVMNEAGDTVEINNFDWDYKINTLTLTFLPNVVSQKVVITVGDDQRYDIVAGQEENVKLSIGVVNGATKDPANSNFTFTIPDGDPAPNPNRTVRTYSDLMTAGGVFYSYCIKCHNSEDKKGGYDITNYAEMVANRVLMPGDPLASEMFYRMNVDAPGFPQMPFQGGLDTAERKKVENWIKAGAKND